MHAKLSRNSLIFQTRAGWGVLSLLLVATVAACLISLMGVQNTQKRLVDSAIPSLNRVEAMSEGITELKSHMVQLDAFATLDEPLKTLANAQSAVQTLLALSDYDAEISNNLRAVAAKLGTMEDLAQTAFETRHVLGDVRAELNDATTRLEGHISGLTIETGAEVEALILTSSDGFDRAAISTGISDLNLASQIQSMFDRQRDLQASLATAASTLEVRELEERMSFNLRAMVRSFVLLSDRPERQILAKAVRDQREILFGETGYIALKKQRFDVDSRSQDALTAIDEAVETISLQINRGVDEARDGILQAAQATEATVWRTILVLSGLSLALLALAFVIGSFIFERRIVHRLAILTQSVRQIAAGDTDWKVGVSGKDEFGEMANALEVFKRNLMELHRSNEELGRFAFAASHDLKSPLRAIHDLAQWTIEDAGDQLPEDCRENLEMLLRRAERLSALLDDLLNYARVGRDDHAVQNVHPAQMVQEIGDILALHDRFDLRVAGDVEVVETFAAPLRQILLNFITNAMKHHDRERGEIAVSFVRFENRLHISVRDDGPGIAPEFHDRVFELFKTLKSRDVVEGSGMGLAIIRKQVEHYGGHVEIISDPAEARGTTFRFDWPVESLASVNPLAA